VDAASSVISAANGHSSKLREEVGMVTDDFLRGLVN
jgi:hypothetical protein